MFNVLTLCVSCSYYKKYSQELVFHQFMYNMGSFLLPINTNICYYQISFLFNILSDFLASVHISVQRYILIKNIFQEVLIKKLAFLCIIYLFLIKQRKSVSTIHGGCMHSKKGSFNVCLSYPT